MHDVDLFALPARFSSLGISDLLESAVMAFPCCKGASVLVDAIHGAMEFHRSAIWINWPASSMMFLGM